MNAKDLERKIEEKEELFGIYTQYIRGEKKRTPNATK
jgi:hypothetical protein